MTQIADRLGTAPSTSTGVVDALVDLGLLERQEDQADRRQVVVAGDGRRAASSSRTSASSVAADSASCSTGSSATTDLRTIERAITLLTDAAGGIDEESTT